VKDAAYCPECGQLLALARVKPDQRAAFTWRSLFLVAVGVYLAVTFGAASWQAAQRIRDARACQLGESGPDCVARPREAGSPVASRNLATGEAFAAQNAEIELERDIRIAVVGCVGLVVGLSAALHRLTRSRQQQAPSYPWLAIEGLVTVLYAEILLIALTQLIGNLPSGSPLTLGRLEDSIYGALRALFALVGVE
jgi:hypothetical protein